MCACMYNLLKFEVQFDYVATNYLCKHSFLHLLNSFKLYEFIQTLMEWVDV